ncbi:DUF983 domain-containing protein [Rhodoflexus sp.]
MASLTYWQGLVQGKCPRCRKGNMYKHSIFNPTKFTDMYTNCPVCDLKFEVEPGFFYGAMYVGYAISVATIITVFTAINILYPKASLSTFIISTVVAIILMIPVNFRYSRIMMLYFFGGVKYEEYIAEKSPTNL